MPTSIRFKNHDRKISAPALALLIVSMSLFMGGRNSVMAQCAPTTQITNVQYLGKFTAPDGTGKVDKFKVDWTTNSPSPCVKVKNYHFTLNITRKLGGQDASAGATANAADRTLTIIMGRDPLLTDPKSYT